MKLLGIKDYVHVHLGERLRPEKYPTLPVEDRKIPSVKYDETSISYGGKQSHLIAKSEKPVRRHPN